MFNDFHPSVCLPLSTQDVTKRYKRKYLGWLQGENRKLHKISGDKNLTELVHWKISQTMWNSLAASCGFAGCAKFVLHLVLQLLLLLILACYTKFLYSHVKMLVVGFLPCISDWLGKGLWSALKLGFFMYLSFNLHCHGFHKILPHSWLVSIIK